MSHGTCTHTHTLRHTNIYNLQLKIEKYIFVKKKTFFIFLAKCRCYHSWLFDWDVDFYTLENAFNISSKGSDSLTSSSTNVFALTAGKEASISIKYIVYSKYMSLYERWSQLFKKINNGKQMTQSTTGVRETWWEWSLMSCTAHIIYTCKEDLLTQSFLCCVLQ